MLPDVPVSVFRAGVRADFQSFHHEIHETLPGLKVEIGGQRLQVGEDLFGLMMCIRCHPTDNAPLPPGVEAADLAPDLQISHERLRPEWVLDWLLDPQQIAPGTRMPTFFPDGQSPLPNVLGGDVQAQIEAIRDYLFLTVGEGERSQSTDD